MPQPGPRLSAEEQAQNLTALHQSVYHPLEITSEMLGAGLWVAYLAFALVWLRTAVRGQRLEWRKRAQDIVVAQATRVSRRLVRSAARLAARPRARAAILTRAASGG
jgi:uncharacterized membrane protein YciS (DUF1049 family)